MLSFLSFSYGLECPEQGDIAGYLEANPNMNQEDFIKRLEEQIHRAVKLKQEVTANPLNNQLKLEMTAYLQTPDIFDKVRLKSTICQHYSISKKDFDILCQHLEIQHLAPQKSVFSLDEFLNQGTEGMQWIVPGLLPVGETILLAALAKTGKTLSCSAPQ